MRKDWLSGKGGGGRGVLVYLVRDCNWMMTTNVGVPSAVASGRPLD